MTKRSSDCTPCKYYVNDECLKETEVDALGWCPEFANRYIERVIAGGRDVR